MLSYKIQFELPVDNPENNVRRTCGKTCMTFYVPINYPSIHKLTYEDLVAAAELSGLLHLSTPLNTTDLKKDQISSNKKVNKRIDSGKVPWLGS